MPAKDLAIRIGVQLSKNITRNLNDFKKNIKSVFSEADKAVKGMGAGLSAAEKSLESLNKIQVFKTQKRDVEQAKQAWKEAEQQVRILANQISESGGASKKLSREFERAKKDASALKQAFQAQEKALSATRAELRAAGINTRALAKEELRLKSAVTASEKKMKEAARIEAARAALGVRSNEKIRAEITALKNAYDRLKKSGTLSAKELYAAQSRLRRQISALKAETNSWSTYLSEARAGIVALAGTILLLREAAGSFGRFTQRMAEVNTLLDVSNKRFSQLTKQVLGLTGEIPQTGEELAAAEYDIISAGVALEDSIGALELSAKAAVAGVTDTKTAVNAGLSVINAYGLGIDQLSNVYDVLFETVKLGVTTFPELSENIGQVLPTARAAGVQFQEVAASIATMTKAGIRTPIAITALRGAINALSAPTAQAQKEFDKLGITWKGLVPTLEALRKQNLSIEQWRALIPDVRARTGVIALVQNLDGLRDTLSHMGSASGAMLEAFDKMRDTPENQIKLFKNEVSKLALSLGGLAAKGILPVLKAIAFLIESVSKADKFTKGLVLTITSSLGLYALWAAGLGKIVFALKGLAVSAHEASGALGVVGGELTALSAVGRVGVVISVAYTGYQVIKLLGEIKELRKINEQNRADAQKDIEAAQRVQYARELQIKSEQELAQMTAQEREEYRQNLVAAMQYYSHLQSAAIRMSNDAMLGGLLPFQSAKGKENEKRAKELGAKVNAYTQALRQLGVAGEEAGNRLARGLSAPQIEVGLAKQAEAIKKRNEALKGELSTLKQVHDQRVKEINASVSGAEREKALLAERNRYYEEVKNKILASYEASIRGVSTYEQALDALVQKEGETSNKVIALQQRVLAAKKEAAENAKQALISALNEAMAKEQEYAIRVQDLTRQIRAAQASLADELRNLRRSQMSEQDALVDKQQEAGEIMVKAREAAAKKEFEIARNYAQKAKALYADIARSGKGAFEEGYAGVQEAGQLYIEVLKQQKEEAAQKWKAQQEATEGLRKAIEGLNVQLKEISQSMAEIPGEKRSVFLFEQKGLEQIKGDYDKIKDKTVTITIKQRTIEERALGGLAGWRRLFSGGHLPGLGGGDRVKAVLEPGEYVHPVKSVQYYGLGLHEILRKRAVPREIIWAAVGAWQGKIMLEGMDQAKRGTVDFPIRMAEGGYVPDPVSSPGAVNEKTLQVVDVNLNFGARSFRLSGSVDVVNELTDYLKKERLLRV